jgi:phospholipid/cholesterol/gamma-HCH transport system substrate-binding protein
VTTEFKVGVVVIFAILLLFYMSFKVGKFGILTEKGYTVTVHFKNVAGLDIKAPVQVAGVEVGSVQRIVLDGTKARVTLLLRNDLKVPTDSVVSIKSFGILGDKYIEIGLGRATTYAKNGEELPNVTTFADIEEIFQNVSFAAKSFGETMDQFKGMFGEKEKENLKASLTNIASASDEFNQMLVENRRNVKTVVTNLADASQKFGHIADQADTTIVGINSIVKDVNAGKGTLGKLVKDEKLYDDASAMVASLRSVSSDIDQGKGTLGKLVKDESLYTDVKESVSNIKGFTAGLKDGKLVTEAQVTMKKIQQAAEGVQEQTPITILGTVFGLFF